MKTRKTKKRNIIRRAVAFLLCMTMVLGLGMQDVIEQVYAEEAIPVIEQEAATEEAGEPAAEEAAPEESADPAEETAGTEETGEQEEPADPAQSTETEEDTEAADPSAPAEDAGTEEGEEQKPSTPVDPAAPTTPAEDGQGGSDSNSKPSTETNPDGNTENDAADPAEDGATVTNPDKTDGEAAKDDAAVSDEEEETTEPEEEQQVYEAEQKVDNVTIHVSAEAGVLPEDAELSVTPIEKKEITEEMSEEEKAEAEEINAQYEETEQKLTEQLQEEAAEEAETLAAEDASVGVNAVSESADADTEAPVVEKMLKGFLSYDIRFLGENGEEIEPEGEVQVSFEFAEAALPDETSENMEVAVKHFKEEKNADGEEEIVVEDLTEAETTNIETEGENSAAVTKVELVADSFSTYTIVWYDYTIYKISLDVQVVDENGEGIYINNWEDSITLNDTVTTVRNIADKIPVPEGYSFLYAKVGDRFNEASKGQEIIRLRYKNGFGGGNQYSFDSSGDNWKSIDWDETVYFIFSRQTSEIGTIETVDSRLDGITLNLFDYDTEEYFNINTGKDFEFTDGSAEHNTDINTYHKGTGEDAVYSDIFRNVMAQENGRYTYPQFSEGINSGETAEYLFSTESASGKTVYADVNHLFTKNEDGYYVYDCDQNFAYYDQRTKNFIVYDVPAAPDGTAEAYMKGSFFPFNELSSNSAVKDWSTGLRNFEKDARGNTLVTKNVHFGMTMSAAFVQPSEGKINDKSMVFNFTGDDDVWVFIDGVLVLDIGGIHDALSGSIDFSTGEVKVTGQPDTNLKELFQDAGKYSEDDFSGNTFKNYTTHTINFYYLERGEGASNCKLEFNIQPIPEGSVVVEKQLGVKDVENQDVFTFTAETSEDGENWEPLETGTEFTISNTSGSGAIETGTIGENGTFTLKAEQRATFEQIDAGTYFRVKEEKNPNYTTSILVSAEDEWGKEESQLQGWLRVSDQSVNRILFTNTQSSSSLLRYDKTAKSIDCDARVYEVDLSASALGFTSGTEGDSASIILVLDASESLSSSAFSSLKNAAERFIDEAVEKTAGEQSGNIEIGVVWYQGTQGSNTMDDTTSFSGFVDVSNTEDVWKLKNITIDSKVKYGGTPMGDALHRAQEAFTQATYEQKYVLLFTDGRPGYNGTSLDCMVANDAHSRAEAMRNAGVTIYTVGYGSAMDDSFSWKEGHSSTSTQNHGKHYTNTTGKKFLSDYIASPDCAFTTYNENDLAGIFESIVGSMGSDITIQTEKIVDVVDPRFNLLVPATGHETSVWKDKDGTSYRIAKTGDTITDKDGNIGTVVLNDGVYQIAWDNITVKNQSQGGWAASFYVKAKEDFIGGNMIPTNSSGSGIYLPDGNRLDFPMPTVNVKLLELEGADKDVSYFKGEAVNPKEFIQKLLDTVEIVELVEENGESVKIPIADFIQKLASSQLDSLIGGEEISVDYSYENTNDIVGEFVLSFAPVPEKGNLNEHQLMTSGNKAEQYVLTVTYKAKSIEERATGNSALQRPENTCEEVHEEFVEPTYSVNVVSGSIHIEKTVSKEDLRAALASGTDKITFTFALKGAIDYTPVYNEDVQIEFTESDLTSSSEYITKEAVVEDLAQDTYTVSEKALEGFEVTNVTATGYGKQYPVQETEVDNQTFTATLKVGLPKEETPDYLQYRDGLVTFTNEMVASKWKIVKVSGTDHEITLEGAQFELTSMENSSIKYIGISDENGVLNWSQNGEPVTALAKGEYTLKEIKAPSGYQLSSETWTVEIAGLGALDTIKDASGNVIKAFSTEEDGTIVYTYTNTVLYDLPSAGGPGIYLYMLGGTLLMMAGALLVYKKRKEEVLRG